MTLDNAAIRTGAKQKPAAKGCKISGPFTLRVSARDGLMISEVDACSFHSWGVHIGWICDPSLTQNQHVEITQDYFKALKLEFFFDDQGDYLGPDDCGIEPMFRAP